MSARTRLVALAGVSLVVALGGCSDSSSSSSDEGSSSGPPPCSDFANGEVITEELSLAGCEGEGVSVNKTTTCKGHTMLAVGPVYGFVGKPAHYLGDGVDATTSPEWKKFQQACPWESE